MRRGKEIAQGAHASLKAVLDYQDHPYVKAWLSQSFTKITVYVNSKEELLDLCVKAYELGLPYSVILDAGRTEFHGVETYTAAAIGPAPEELVSRITGALPLY